MQTDVRRIQGSDGISLHLCVWSPDSILEAKGVIQLLHGQGEYAGRYEHVGQYLTDRGFIVYANDHRGHGLTVFDAPEDADEEHQIPGHMADVDGWNKCLADLGIIRDIIRSRGVKTNSFATFENNNAPTARTKLTKRVWKTLISASFCTIRRRSKPKTQSGSLSPRQMLCELLVCWVRC